MTVEHHYMRPDDLERIGLPPGDSPAWEPAYGNGKARRVPEDDGIEFALSEELLEAVIASPQLRQLIDEAVAKATPKRRWWHRRSTQ